MIEAYYFFAIVEEDLFGICSEGYGQDNTFLCPEDFSGRCIQGNYCSGAFIPEFCSIAFVELFRVGEFSLAGAGMRLGKKVL